MTTAVEKQVSGFDKLLILVAIALLIAGIYGFYYFADDGLKSTAAMFGGAIGAIVVFFQSQPGKDLWAFARLSLREMKKVVWPTHPEALQTTIAVIICSILMALFFWICDVVLIYITSLVRG